MDFQLRAGRYLPPDDAYDGFVLMLETSEGKTPREITRCLKRHTTRQLYKLLETLPDPLDAT